MSTARGTGSIPGQETKIPHALWRDQKKKKKKMGLENIDDPGERNIIRARVTQGFEDEDLHWPLRHKAIGLTLQR